MAKDSTKSIQKKLTEIGEDLGFYSKKEFTFTNTNSHYSPCYDVVWFLNVTELNIRDLEGIQLYEGRYIPFAAFEIEGSTPSSKYQIGNIGNLLLSPCHYRFMVVDNSNATKEKDTYRRGIKITRTVHENIGDHQTIFIDASMLDNLESFRPTFIHSKNEFIKRDKGSGGETKSKPLNKKVLAELANTNLSVYEDKVPEYFKMLFAIEKHKLFPSTYTVEPIKFEQEPITKDSSYYYKPRIDISAGFKITGGFIDFLKRLAINLKSDVVQYPLLHFIETENLTELYYPLLGIEIETANSKHAIGSLINASKYHQYGWFVGTSEMKHVVDTYQHHLGLRNVVFRDAEDFTKEEAGMKFLLVQSYFDGVNKYNYHNIYDKILDIISEQPVDLIIFPEAFIYGSDDINDCFETTRSISDFCNTPVLVGVSCDFGTEEAYFYNPVTKDETEWKLYVKHSSAEQVAFDINYDEEYMQQLYKPIMLNGKKIQVCICHDMFYPLLMERLEQEGMDILINLTGRNVKMSKWTNILRGRSIEMEGPVLCTMAYHSNMSQKSERIAYQNGQRLQPIFTQGDGRKEHAFSIFDLEHQSYIDDIEPNYSPKEYTEFTVSKTEGDCTVTNDASFETELPFSEEYERSIILEKDKERIHVHACEINDLYDRTYVYRAPREGNEHEVFIYFSDKEVESDIVIAMLKLRVIENRIAAVIVAPNLMIGAKTTQHKDVQLFEGDTIGFNLQNMKGFDSVYIKEPNKTEGLNLKFKEEYEALIQ
ncbi:nitrilase-related carbon-nitrogen hydrolase [Bacillus bombysepticus]|uniref:nitrilase-related carbon-nitrogen hydrolase n=1 Tax=Bacillus bombysepticus TaxID=658666 RepID=UPI003016F503